MGKIVKDLKKLHQVSIQVDMGEESYMIRSKVMEALISTYKHTLDKKCQGLAAVQIGYNESCILLQFDKTKRQAPIVVFNPEILISLGSKRSLEGCISEGDGRWFVKRPLLCKVSFYYVNGDKETKWLWYKKARIFCHEYDHTKGVLLQDKGVKVL